MRIVEIVCGLLIAVVVLVRLARWVDAPPAIPLVVGGVLLSYAPGLGVVRLDPELVFALFLPPLLFYAAWQTSWRDFRRNARPIGLLAVGLVLLTTFAVGAVAHEFVGLPWGAAFTLGAIVSPTDAVSATTVINRLGVPRRIVTVLEGESLVNDASGIVAYRVAVAAVVSGAFSVWEAGWEFLWSSSGGVGVGICLGWLSVFLLRRFDDPPVETTVSLMTPFVAYLLGEAIHVSGVLAVVAAGLYLARRSSRITSSDTRLQGRSFWQMLDFLFNGVLFLLVGLQLRLIINGLAGRSAWESAGFALIISLTVIVARVVWVFPATYLPRLLSASLRARDPVPPWQQISIVAWTGMRGAVSLAAALSLPYATGDGAPFPERDLIIFLTFAVIVATLVAQGLGLPPLIKALGLHDDGATAREEAEARLRVARSALGRVEELASNSSMPKQLIERVRADYEHRAASIESALGAGERGCQELFQPERWLRAQVLEAERDEAVSLRESGAIGDEVLHRVERDIDLEEQRLKSIRANDGQIR